MTDRTRSHAIGMFDSGMGGLSVLREIRLLLPHEDILYYADNAHCPYGSRSEAFVRDRVLHIAHFLLRQGAKLLVVACNTASIAALDHLRTVYPAVPIVGMEPAVKPAAAATRNRRIGVLATTVTLHGDRFESLLQRYAQDVKVVTQPGTGLVERVEAGLLDAPETLAWLRELLAPFREAGVDTLVLGSTHFPFLRPAIAQVLGPDVTLIDTGAAVARRVHQLLQEHDLLASGDKSGSEALYTSGDPAVVGPIMARLLGRLVVPIHRD
jgi:glutamate racemase